MKTSSMQKDDSYIFIWPQCILNWKGPVRIIHTRLPKNQTISLREVCSHFLNTSKLSAMTAFLNNKGLEERLGLLPFQVFCSQWFKDILCHNHSEG